MKSLILFCILGLCGLTGCEGTEEASTDDAPQALTTQANENLAQAGGVGSVRRSHDASAEEARKHGREGQPARGRGPKAEGSCFDLRAACHACAEPQRACRKDAGCRAILSCVETTGCDGTSCLLGEGLCRGVILANFHALSLANAVPACRSEAGCCEAPTQGQTDAGSELPMPEADASYPLPIDAGAPTDESSACRVCEIEYCGPQLNSCLSDSHCAALLACRAQTGCHGLACANEPECASILEEAGGTSSPTGLHAAALSQCEDNNGCVCPDLRSRRSQ